MRSAFSPCTCPSAGPLPTFEDVYYCALNCMVLFVILQYCKLVDTCCYVFCSYVVLKSLALLCNLLPFSEIQLQLAFPAAPIITLAALVEPHNLSDNPLRQFTSLFILIIEPFGFYWLNISFNMCSIIYLFYCHVHTLHANLVMLRCSLSEMLHWTETKCQGQRHAARCVKTQSWSVLCNVSVAIREFLNYQPHF